MSVTTGREPARMERTAVPTSERVLTPLARASVRFLVIAAAGAVVAYALVHVRLAVVPFVAALLAATLLRPPARWLHERGGIPSGVAALLVIVLAIAAVGGAFTLIVPAVVSELGTLGETVREGIDKVTAWIAQGPFGLERGDLERMVDRAAGRISTGASGVAAGLVSVGIVALEIVAGILIALVVLFFLIHDGDRMWRWALWLMPATGRDRVQRFGEEAWAVLTAYIRGVVVIALVDAVFIGLALLAIGVPLVLPLAVLTFLGAFVPLVGAFVAGAVAALVALVSAGIGEALLVVLAITAIQQLEGNLLYPVIVGRALELHPVAILLAVTAGGVLLGIVGAALAVPLTAVAWTGYKVWRESDDP